MQRLQSNAYVCSRCLLNSSARIGGQSTVPAGRFYSSNPQTPSEPRSKSKRPKTNLSSKSTDAKQQEQVEEEGGQGAMARRLQEATEEALLTGGRSGFRAVEDAGFSEELKEKLYEKVASAQFRAKYAGAFAHANDLPASGPAASLAAAAPWTGEESQHDAVLRMLDDARKPLPPELRAKFRPPDPTRGGQPVDLRIRREKPVSSGQRAASARDRAAAYVGMGLGKETGASGATAEGGAGLSEEEKEAVRKEFKERFAPGARSASSISGIAALANERIEDAIARGQFKNIPRGPGVGRDSRADNPFIDTTEYIMNNMIKRQDVVPPWIEKQQQLSKEANTFRARLRADWLRHAARSIASRGGTLEEQVARAEAYARAETARNPARRRNPEDISLASNATDDPVMVKLRQSVEVTTTPSPPMVGEAESAAATAAAPTVETAVFRDPAWEATEQKYMALAVETLNALARSYNLMAPELAKKPYFSLRRELDACFADVAPRVGQEIRNRATARPVRPLAGGVFGGSAGGSAASMGRVRVYENKAPYYGFKEMWRDWWGKKT